MKDFLGRAAVSTVATLITWLAFAVLGNPLSLLTTGFILLITYATNAMSVISKARSRLVLDRRRAFTAALTFGFYFGLVAGIGLAIFAFLLDESFYALWSMLVFAIVATWQHYLNIRSHTKKYREAS